MEVYSPRELRAAEAWVKEVSDLLNYVDIQATYSSSVETGPEQSIPPEPSQFDPWAPAKMLAQTREEVSRSGAWEPPAEVSDGGDSGAEVAVDASQRPIVVWSRDSSGAVLTEAGGSRGRRSCTRARAPERRGGRQRERQGDHRRAPQIQEIRPRPPAV